MVVILKEKKTNLSFGIQAMQVGTKSGLWLALEPRVQWAPWSSTAHLPCTHTHTHTQPLELTLCTLSSLSDKNLGWLSGHNCKPKSGTSQHPAPTAGLAPLQSSALHAARVPHPPWCPEPRRTGRQQRLHVIHKHNPMHIYS